MGPNTRLLIRSFKNVIILNNPIIALFLQIKKIIDAYSELPQKSHNISNVIRKDKAKLEKTQLIMERNSRSIKSSSINLVR